MAKKPERKKALGRGLSALMSDVAPQDTVPAKAEASIPIDQIHPNPDQPRRTFHDDALQELAASIREKGIIQPLVLRPVPNKPKEYEIVAGERRWRAAQMAQLHEVPAILRDFDDTEVLEIAIIENIQRADLNAMEEAVGYRQLMDRFGHTQEKLAQALGKSRSHIANTMRLVDLPEEVQQMVRNGQLSPGHARALITSPNAVELARDAIKKGLSVRQIERLAKAAPQAAPPKVKTKDADTRALEDDLMAALKMRISIDHKPGSEGGSLTISYKTLDQLDELCQRLSATAEIRLD
ncbi:MAG: ParB/RepB/Spo0J family partition protein [Pseudomonadota bacterium]